MKAKLENSTDGEVQQIKMHLRDRDTGELVMDGVLDVHGRLELIEVGLGYVDLLKQIGVNVGST